MPSPVMLRSARCASLAEFALDFPGGTDGDAHGCRGRRARAGRRRPGRARSTARSPASGSASRSPPTRRTCCAGRVVEVLEASPARVDAAVRPRARGLRRLRLAARRDRDAAAAQARHHPRRAPPHRPHRRPAARRTGPAPDRGVSHDGARPRRRRQARVPQAPVARSGDDRLVHGRAPADRRAPAAKASSAAPPK